MPTQVNTITPEQLARFRKNVIGPQAKKQQEEERASSFGKRAVRVPPREGFTDLDELEPGDVIDMAKNLPFVLSDFLVSMKSMVTEFPEPELEMAKTLASAPLEVLSGPARGVANFMTEQTGEGEMLQTTKAGDLAKMMAENFIRSPRRTFVENPDEFLDVVAITSGPLKTLGKKTAARLMEEAAALAAKKGIKAIDMTGQGTKLLVTGALSMPTGAAQGAIRAVYEAGKKGGRGNPAVTAFKKARTGEVDIMDVRDIMINHGNMFKEKMYADYRQGFADLKLKDPKKPIDIERLQLKMLDLLDEGNIGFKLTFGEEGWDIKLFHKSERGTHKRKAEEVGPSGISLSPAQQSQLESFVNDVVDITKDMDSGQVHHLDALKKAIDNEIKPNATDNNQFVNNFKRRYRSEIRNELGDKVEGYNKLTSDYEDARKFLDDWETTFALEGNLDTAINKIARSMSDLPSNKRKRALIDAMDAEYGQHIKELIAGAELSTFVPKGLVGRGLAGGAFFYASAGGGGATALYGMPFALPRTVGWMMSGAGQMSGEIKKFTEKVLKPIYDEAQKRVKSEGMIVEGLSYGEIAERLSMTQAELQIAQREDEIRKRIQDALKDQGILQDIFKPSGGNGMQAPATGRLRGDIPQPIRNIFGDVTGAGAG